MNIPFSDVNFIAVFGTSVACMVIGFLWYSEGVFGAKWMKLVGIKKSKPSKSDMQSSMVKGFVATLIANYFLAVVLLLVGTRSMEDAMLSAVVLWLATFLPSEIHSMAWEKRPLGLVYINGGNTLVTYVVAAAILQWWPA